MPETRVRIQDLRLRLHLPGVGPAEAQRLAREVARELAAHPPAATHSASLGAVDLKVTVSSTGGTSPLAARIADSLRRALP